MPDAINMTLGLNGFFWARPLSTPLMIAVFVGVVLLSLYLYRKSWGIPMWLRVSLGLARLIALALVVASALWANLGGGMKIVAYGLAIAGWIATFFAGTIRFTFYGVEFSFKAYIPMLGGIFIAALASFLGI